MKREQQIAEAFFEALVVDVDQVILWSNGNRNLSMTEFLGLVVAMSATKCD